MIIAQEVKTIHLNPSRAMDFEEKPHLQDPVQKAALRICDPLANSELARLEDEVNALRSKISEVESLRQEFESYREVTKKLAVELSAFHKVFKTIGNVDAHNVASLAASIFVVPLEEMMSPARPAYLVQPRMAAMYVMKNRLGMTLESIGGFFKRDHGTVMHACRTVEKMLAKDARFADRVEKMVQTLASREEVIPASLIGHTLVGNLPATRKGPKKKAVKS